MKELHLDSQAIDRVGIPAIVDHFDVRRQTVHYWRRQGVPADHRQRLAALGRKLGHEMPELKITRDRKRGRPRTSGSLPTSSTMSA
jgi:hypothetical protein